MNTVRLSIIVVLSMLLLAVQLPAEDVEIDWGNRFSAQFSYRGSDDYSMWMADLGWKPELFAEYPFEQDWRLSAEVSLDNHLRYLYVTQANELDWELKLYRAWAALSYKDTELKAGLQHIRFGPAQVFRPLQWFDNLDPLSLLQDSEGVTALTLTHFFPNPDIKLWLLPGTDKPRYADWGIATQKGTVEFGGHLGVLSPLGETGLSYNQRTVHHNYEDSNSIKEYQVGLDQRIDSIVGAWLEADVSMLSKPPYLGGVHGGIPEPKWRGSTTIGADYTIGIGNGLYCLGEVNHTWGLFYPNPYKYVYDFGDNYRGAIVLRYPLGILDSIQLITNIHTFSDSPVCPSITLSWRRAYDKLSWDLSLGYTTYATSLSMQNTGRASFTINYDM